MSLLRKFEKLKKDPNASSADVDEEITKRLLQKGTYIADALSFMGGSTSDLVDVLIDRLAEARVEIDLLREQGQRIFVLGVNDSTSPAGKMIHETYYKDEDDARAAAAKAMSDNSWDYAQVYKRELK